MLAEDHVRMVSRRTFTMSILHCESNHAFCGHYGVSLPLLWPTYLQSMDDKGGIVSMYNRTRKVVIYTLSQ